MKHLKENEVKTLHYLVRGKNEVEIGVLLNRSAKTVADYRRNLMKFFGAESTLDLVKNAFIFGFCDELLSDLDNLRPEINFEALSIDLILMLHETIKGRTLHEMAARFNLKLEQTRLRYLKMCTALKTKYAEDLFIHSLVIGYIRLVPVSAQNVSKVEMKQLIEDWVQGNSVLKVEKYHIEYEYMRR